MTLAYSDIYFRSHQVKSGFGKRLFLFCIRCRTETDVFVTHTKTVLTFLRNVRNPSPQGDRTNWEKHMETMAVQRCRNTMNVSSHATSQYSQRFTSCKTGVIEEIKVLTDVFPKHVFYLFLLESAFDDELIISINGTTAKLPI